MVINMIANRIISLIFRVARGRSVSTLGGISPASALAYVMRKGLMPALRGIFFKLFVGRSDGLIFIGKGVQVIAPKFLNTGKKVYIGDFCRLDCYSTGGVFLGDQVTIREFGWMQLTSHINNPGSSVRIGSQTYIGPRVTLGAAAELVIGERCQIGANVSFIAENHEFNIDSEIFEQGVTRAGIIVGNDCWIGNNVCVLDGVKIGDGVVIGAGSIVTKDIPSYSIAAGVPARIIRKR